MSDTDIMTLNPPFNRYRGWVLDCDGVILNSNPAKTEAFRRIALPYGADRAEAPVAHHIENGGVSRHRKMAHFLSEIVGTGPTPKETARLLEAFAAEGRTLMPSAQSDLLAAPDQVQSG